MPLVGRSPISGFYHTNAPNASNASLTSGDFHLLFDFQNTSPVTRLEFLNTYLTLRLCALEHGAIGTSLITRRKGISRSVSERPV